MLFQFTFGLTINFLLSFDVFLASVLFLRQPKWFHQVIKRLSLVGPCYLISESVIWGFCLGKWELKLRFAFGGVSLKLGPTGTSSSLMLLEIGEALSLRPVALV